MTITTYAELQSSIAGFLNRDDLTAEIKTFIALGEAELRRDVRHWRQEKRSTAEIDTQYSAVPADFLEVIRFYVTSNDTRPLELISQYQLLDRKAGRLNAGGFPAYYAITAGEIEVFPVPDGTYTAELYYYADIPSLSDSATSNWVLQYHPDAYLYSALKHSAPFLVEDQRLTVWAALYQAAIDRINEDSERVKAGGSGRRMKIRSY
jgi:hypothetical protein